MPLTQEQQDENAAYDLDLEAVCKKLRAGGRGRVNLTHVERRAIAWVLENSKFTAEKHT